MTHSPEKFLQNTSSMQHLSTAVRCVVEQLVYNYSMKSRSRSLLLHVTRCNFFCQRNGRCEVSHIVSAHASRVVFLRGVLRPCIAVVTQDPIQADNKRHRGEYVPRPCFVDAGTCTVCMSTLAPLHARSVLSHKVVTKPKQPNLRHIATGHYGLTNLETSMRLSPR